MCKVTAMITARMTSSRLPGKVLKQLNGKSVFYHIVERLKQCEKISNIYLATSKNELNKPLIAEAKKCGVQYYAGAEEDVLERYIAIARKEKADIVVRCGGDMPLVSHEIVNQLLGEYKGEDLLYVVTTVSSGVETEILSLGAMERIQLKYRGPAISKYIFEYPHLFKSRGIEVDNEFSRPEFRLTLDTEEDYQLLMAIYNNFYNDGVPIDIKEVLRFLDDHPELANINRFVKVKDVNLYVRKLKNMPTFSIYQSEDNNYVVKNRMGEIVSYAEFQKVVNQIEWK